ncbi:uncharacterized protein CLIP-190 isoform X5 [Epargyreus clarus]|uniref:uncharacterized protein CLIP-190 isoform X5 n=1 Tax=Epargyreus clarus TaxID=520877 RepID=UPI003C2F83CA
MSDTQEPPGAAAPPAPSSTSSDAASSVSTTASTIPRSDHPRPTTLPKPSGLKPPSKIGRLCSNSAPKPAVPISPRTDGSSSDTLRKLSDDSSRKHLSDLIEAEEDEVSSSLPDRRRSFRKASTGSTLSGISMEALWEKHARRLSEAGLRRSSDHSVVLTEDTDSFIIGERVWVGGTKPGQIAYIGETQFAPGEWAGIVLDEPIGKNDGSVAGVRYFQCPEKRGVFSRLTRLTREALISHAPHDASPVSDAGSVFERPPSGSARPRRTLSPNGSVRSFVSSKMNASISTTTNGELRMGDRVIVSSSRGSKAGTLRYVGVTEFASGVWAGVELDDPLGKNDGSVDGKRYFECAPRFGLFAPISKVSRSPSNRKPGACAIHSNGRATPLRRSNSRESLTSLGTSIASSRAGELLREKQLHLERLMRERELERAEVAKVSLQAERAESALSQIKKEATQANSENAKLKAELDKLSKMLEDERQKVEDLMFRNEEENINKEDYNKYKEAMLKELSAREQQVRTLEAEAALQAARADSAAAALRALAQQRDADVAALADQHREELNAAQTLSSELQKLLDEAYALLKEKENEKDSLGKSMSDELSRVKIESEKALTEARTKLAIAQTEFETQMSVLTAKLQLAESKLDTEKQSVERLNKENSQIIIDLNSKVTQLQAALDDKSLELNKVLGGSKEHEVNLNKEITKLKMELSAKVLDNEQLDDSKRKHEAACKLLQEEVNRVKDELTNKVNEYESFLNEASQQDEKNKSEILKLEQALNAKTKDYERLLNESSSSTNSNEKIVNEYKQTIHERDKEIIKLKDDFEQATANFNIKHSKIAEEHKKEIEDRNTKIEQLMKEIETHKQNLDQSKFELDSLTNQFTINVDELNSLKQENENLKKSVAELTQINNDLKEKISAMELNVGELKRQLESTIEKCGELQKSKEKIESEYMNLTGQATDSNEQFNKLSQHLKETEKELQDLRDKCREASNNHGRIEQELKQKLFKLEEDFAAERGQLVRSVNDNIEKQQAAENKIKELEARTTDTINRIKEIETQNDKLLDENSILKKEIECLKIKEQETNSEFEGIRKKLEVDIDRYKEEISLLKAEGATSEVKLMEKVDQLTEAQNDLNNKLEEARKHEDSLQKILDDMNAQLSNQKIQHEKEITQYQAQLSAITNEVSLSKTEENRLKALLEEKQNNVKELSLKLEMLEVDVKSHEEMVKEKDRQVMHINEELNKTIESKNKLEEQLNNIHMETSALKQKYETLLSNSSSEESLLKEHLSHLETLRIEMAALVNEKSQLETQFNGTTNELNKLKNEYEETVKNLNDNITSNNNLKKLLEEKENEIKTQNNKNQADVAKSKLIENELNQLKQDIENKNKETTEREHSIAVANDALSAEYNQIQQLVKSLENENAEIKEKYNKEVESLTTTTKSLQSRVAEQEKQIKELENAKEKVTELQQLLAKSESDIKQLTNINDGQKLNYEDLNKQLQTQFDEYKKESKSIRHELKNKVKEYERELHDSRENIKTESNKQSQLQEKLVAAEKSILELSQKLELATVQQTTNVTKDEKLEKLTLELQATRQANVGALANSEKIINALRTDVEHKMKDLRAKDEYIRKLQDDLKNYQTKTEIAEREKAMLQKKIANNSQDIRDKNDNTAIGVLGQGDTATLKAQEEQEVIEGQVSFLNSVIVDMQRKNEQLLARVQALESGSVTEPPLFNGRKARAVAPRRFCDICDVFDAHDTEDCPRQAAAAAPDAPAQPPRRAPPPPRPYCDICEVFGHATENCDEEETF